MTGCYIVCESITLWIASFLAMTQSDAYEKRQTESLPLHYFTSHFSLFTPHYQSYSPQLTQASLGTLLMGNISVSLTVALLM